MSLISGIEKFSTEEGYVTNFCDFFLSHGTEKLRRGTFCNRKFSGWKGGCLKSRGSITIFCKNFFISQSRKRSSGTLLFFRKFRVSRFFMIKRGLSQFLIKKFVVSQYRRTS